MNERPQDLAGGRRVRREARQLVDTGGQGHLPADEVDVPRVHVRGVECQPQMLLGVRELRLDAMAAQDRGEHRGRRPQQARVGVVEDVRPGGVGGQDPVRPAVDADGSAERDRDPVSAEQRRKGERVARLVTCDRRLRTQNRAQAGGALELDLGRPDLFVAPTPACLEAQPATVFGQREDAHVGGAEAGRDELGRQLEQVRERDAADRALADLPEGVEPPLLRRQPLLRDCGLPLGAPPLQLVPVSEHDQREQEHDRGYVPETERVRRVELGEHERGAGEHGEDDERDALQPPPVRHRGPQRIKPSRTAMTTACVRLRAPSRVVVLRTWPRTVSGERKS